MTLEEAYSGIPSEFRAKYSFTQITDHVFKGIPTLEDMDMWLKQSQSDIGSLTYRACLKILAARKIAFENGCSNEENLNKVMNNIVEQVLAFANRPDIDAIVALGKAWEQERAKKN